MDKRALKRLDRETNQAMKRAHSVAERFAIQADAKQRRRRLMLGMEDAQEEVQTIDAWPLVGGTFTITPNYEGLNESIARMADAFRGMSRTLSWAFEEPTEWKQAKARAWEFLLSHLNDEQKQSVKQRGYFVTYNKTSGRAWRIRTNTTAYNVDALDKSGKVINTFCAIPSGERLPDGDVWLAQKILLETDEVEFLLQANRKQSGAGYEIRLVNSLSAL